MTEQSTRERVEQVMALQIYRNAQTMEAVVILSLDTTVSGIPAKIKCEVEFRDDGMTDYQFTVYDKRGNLSPWLNNKLTKEDVLRIENQIESVVEKCMELHTKGEGYVG